MRRRLPARTTNDCPEADELDMSAVFVPVGTYLGDSANAGGTWDTARARQALRLDALFNIQKQSRWLS
eukprot:9140787-Karenia_brevis.AAC.1